MNECAHRSFTESNLDEVEPLGGDVRGPDRLLSSGGLPGLRVAAQVLVIGDGLSLKPLTYHLNPRIGVQMP